MNDNNTTTTTNNNTVSFHNFKSRNFKLSVSNPQSKYVAYSSVLSRISNCQGLGRKNKHDLLKTDRILFKVVIIIIFVVVIIAILFVVVIIAILFFRVVVRLGHVQRRAAGLVLVSTV